jgi:hypothetical protein
MQSIQGSNVDATKLITCMGSNPRPYGPDRVLTGDELLNYCRQQQQNAVPSPLVQLSSQIGVS